MRTLVLALLVTACAASPQYAPCHVTCGTPGEPCTHDCPDGFWCRQRDGLSEGYCSTGCATDADCSLGGLLPSECTVGPGRPGGHYGADHGVCFVAQGCSIENQCPAGTMCGGDGWCEP